MKKNSVDHSKLFKVPFFAPWITNSDKKAVLDALGSTFLTDGPLLRKFESEFARFTGAKYAIGVSNATTALHLSLIALGIGKGDEVIVPDMTFVATANAVAHSGATPVFADIEKDDLNISIESIEENLSKKTKAILPVHFAGKICNIEKISNFAKKHNLVLIEDCAHAIGARYKKKHVGNFGNAGCFSFYPTKNITTIEGGMIITNSQKVADDVRQSRNHGITRSLSQRYSKGKPWEYDVIHSGYNYRLDEIRSALGLSQLKRIRKLNLLRRNACKYYSDKLKNVKGIIVPPTVFDESNVNHLYIMRVQSDYGISRDELFQRFMEKGISVTVHYKPLHEFTVFEKRIKNMNRVRNTIDAYQEIISLPLFPQISRTSQDLVIECIRENQK
ncbi:MAG TPA: DegT/DnrJ/EryC1/StrS family aminotransferase [Candidatus Nitrosotalea sp.]|nr:DegT/DnrJ/EryC1/StrS family aminotransferase [Candidatus Nitrosotalea sp.]